MNYSFPTGALRGYFKLLPLIVLFSLSQLKVSASPYLVLDGDPWGQNHDEVSMDAVFGAGNWMQANTSTTAAIIFQASTPFVMLEGSDGNANMPSFINANITLIENWVAAGGRLFIDAAPNYPGNQTWGFGGTVLNYPSFAGQVATSVPGNQIFLGPYTPTTTSYTGGSFAHAWISGSGLTSLLYNTDYAPDAQPVLAYKAWGSGTVFFGGCTQPGYWSPNPEGYNLWQNIFALAAGPVVVNVTIGCPGNITSCMNVVNNIAPVVNGGNCAAVTYTLAGATTGGGVNDASGTNFNVGTTIVKYVATNICTGPSDSCSFSVTIYPPTGLLAGNNAAPEFVTIDVAGPVDVRYTDCDLMASIIPSGNDPIHDNTLVKVTIDNPMDEFNGQPFVERHFDIEPGTSANSATASLSLYSYQYEFDKYNLAAGPLGLPLLPTGGVDNGNVRISQFHGVGTAPANYPGPEELIYPSVNWNATYNYWEMTFDVTGFSGFYIHTAFGNHALALQISDISAINKGASNRVDWTTATEAKGDVMTLERSTDGSTFAALTEMPANGKASTYTYWDEKPVAGINYYRVRLTNANRDVTYTKVVNASVKGTDKLSITASPNPVLNKVMVNITGTQNSTGMIQVTDPAGKVLLKVAAETNSAVIDMSGMPSGLYFIKYTNASGSVITRITKQ